MRRIHAESMVGWKLAKKTKPVKAKPLISLLVDRSIVSKFLIDTLEGKEPLGDGVVICIGEFNDAWQQSPKKLLAKYDVVSIDNDGWMLCNPKPENAAEVVEVREAGPFYIVGLWGATLDDGTKNVQIGEQGDFILRSREDHNDVWIVRRKIFNSTYSIRD